VIVHFVDIRGIVDHHCLNFLFIIHKNEWIFYIQFWWKSL